MKTPTATQFNGAPVLWRASSYPIYFLSTLAVVGLLVALVLYNLLGFSDTAKLNMANTEVLSVRTASLGFMAENMRWPEDESDLAPYFNGTVVGEYYFDANTGFINSAKGWADFTFNPSTQMWESD